jgi:predicted nucleic acid-binding protein
MRLVAPGPASSTYKSTISRLQNDGIGLVAPSLWVYETTSALCKAVRFERLTAVEAEGFLDILLRVGVRLVVPNELLSQLAIVWTIRLRRAAAYDSFYLALAETLSCDLWTADRRLFNAVNLPWVRFVGDNGEESREAATRSHDG